MTDLKPNDHARLRRAFRYLDDEAPLGPDLPEHDGASAAKRRPWHTNPAMVVGGAVLATLLLFVPIALLVSGSDPAETPIQTPASPATTPESTQAPDEPEPDYLDRFPVLVEVEETGVLIGLERGHAFKSPDGGESWNEILVDGGADLIDVAPDGTVIAVNNSEHEDSTPALGPDSSVRPAPKVHIYDPVTDEWRTNELPRPEFPVDNPQPVPMDGSGNCPKGGIQWTMDALSLAIGDRYLIAGEQRITEQNICDQSYQVFWTSSDTTNWTIVEPTGVPGYVVGITWFDGTYVVYGSDSPWYSMGQKSKLRIWTSKDLETWESAEFDLSVLPSNAYPSMFPDEEETWGLGFTVLSTVTEGVLHLNVPIGLAAPGPDAGFTDVEELNLWAEANDRSPISNETLDQLDIDFPLDQEELEKLTNYFAADEGYGRLILETRDGVTWTSRYESG